MVKHRKGEGESNGVLPYEMYFEILSRLPLKSIGMFKTVCRSWNIIGSNVKNNIRYLAQCGLLIGLPDFYICLKSCNPTNFSLENSVDECVLSSGYDKGFLADLAFDFGELFENAPWEREPEQGLLRFCTVNRGLLLFGSDDGRNLHVQNPATLEYFVVPESPMIENYQHTEDISLMIRGFQNSDLSIIRFSPSREWVDYYSSKTGEWFEFKSNLDDDLRHSDWHMVNYAAVVINGVEMVFFSTSNKRRGIVVKLGIGGDSTTPVVASSVELPAKLEQDFNTRFGGYGGCLYLSHLSQGGCLSIWKQHNDGTGWVLLHEINITQRFKAVIVDDPPVSNLGFNENELIVYLYTNSKIVSYNITDDTLLVICRLNTESTSSEPIFVPCAHYTPFLGGLPLPQV